VATRVKFEGLIPLGSASITTSTEADERSQGAINTHTHFTDNIVRVGLNYRFH